MSYPNIIYGDYGDEKVAQSTKIGSLPLGQLMILPDGRKFRHAQAGAASLGAGVVVSTSAVQTGHGGIAAGGLLASATTTYNAISATTIRLLSKATGFTTDQYADGILNIQGGANSAQIGHIYRIKSNKSCASASELEIELEKGDGLKVALSAAASFCSLRRSPYRDAIIAASTKAVMGTVPVAVSASYYFWMQRGGPASLEQGASAVTDGSAVTYGGQAGSVRAGVASSVTTQTLIGKALEGATAAEAALVYLDLE